MLGTWGVPQHSPARCHLPLLSLLVTLPEPWGCSHTQPCPWRHCPCPCLAPVTVTPVPGVAATSPPLLPRHPGATCRRPATPPGQPPAPGRLRGCSRRGAAVSASPGRTKAPLFRGPAGTKRSLLERGRPALRPALAGPVGSRSSGGAGHGSRAAPLSPATPRRATLRTLFIRAALPSPGCHRCVPAKVPLGVTRCATRCPRPVGGCAVVTVALVTRSAWCCWAMSPLPPGTR